MRRLCLLCCLGWPSLLPADTSPADLDRLWEDLASMEATRAYQAMCRLKHTPNEACAYLGTHLPAVVAPDPVQLEQLLADLNSDRFAVREKANRELEKLGSLAEPMLKKAVRRGLPLEVRQRVDKLLNKLVGPVATPEQLRAIRTVEILEGIGDAGATKLLERYAAGGPGARLTEDARAALIRLKERDVVPPQSGKPATTDLYGDPLPPGAVARLGTIRFRHEGGEVAFLPGDRTLIRVANQQVRIWDAASGQLVREVSLAPFTGQASVLSADGKQLVVAGLLAGGQPAAEIRVIEISSGKTVHSLPRQNPQDVFNCQLALSADGKKLFSLASTGDFRVEELATGKRVLLRGMSPNYSGGIGVSPDGTSVAIAFGPNVRKLYLWRWRDEQPRELAGSDSGVTGVAFSPDGKLLAAVGDNDGTVRVWEVPSRRPLYHRDFSNSRYYFSGRPVFTPDGKLLAVSARDRQGSPRGKIELFEAATGNSQAVLPGSGNMTISSDSKRLAFVSGRALRIFDIASRTELNPNDASHESDPTQIVVSPRGMIATAGDDYTVRLWDATTGKQGRKFAVDGWIRAIDVAPDGKLLAASSLDDTVHVWETASGQEIYRLAGHGQYGGRRMLRFDPTGRTLLSWGDDFYLRVWDMKNGKARFEHAIRPEGVNVPDDENERQQLLAFKGIGPASSAATPDGKTFILDIAGNLHLFDVASGRALRTLPSQARVSAPLTVSPDGKYVLTADRGLILAGVRPVRGNRAHSLSLVDLASGKAWHKPVAGIQPGPVAFSADSRTFAGCAGQAQDEILIYELASGDVRYTIPGLPGRVRSLAFLNDSQRLASGLSDSTVLVWDLGAPVGR